MIFLWVYLAGVLFFSTWCFISWRDDRRHRRLCGLPYTWWGMRLRDVVLVVLSWPFFLGWLIWTKGVKRGIHKS